MEVTIRHATPADAPEISRLIQTVAKQCVKDDFLTEVGKVKFFNSTSQSSISEYLKGAFLYWVAEHEGTVTGIIAIKENNHIFHLFVDPNYQGKGIATLLWQNAYKYAKERGNPGEFTVYSSSFAQSLYKKWGFQKTQAFMIKNGIRSIPMKLEVA
ncbi:MAG: GNAT family N-acetyltransferase [Flammeovirgaceae bacterium]